MKQGRFPLVVVFVFAVPAFSLSRCTISADFDRGTPSGGGGAGDSESSGNGSGNDSDGSGGSSTETGTIDAATGMMKAADGSPLNSVAVALSASSSSASLARTRRNLRNDRGHYRALPMLTDTLGNSCEDLDSVVDGTILAEDCSDTNGLYQLDGGGSLPCGSDVTFTAKKGSFFMSCEFTIPCRDSNDDGDYTDETVDMGDVEFIAGEEVTVEEDGASRARGLFQTEECIDVPRMAVVTGDYDKLQDVLAKLGYGEVDADGHLDDGQSYDFTLIDGNDSLDDTLFDDFDDWVADVENLSAYDMVFINSGNGQESLAADATVLANLQQYVEEGGRLFASDWSYMFIENPFPGFIDFYGGGSVSSSSEADDSYPAKAGEDGVTFSAWVGGSGDDGGNGVFSGWLISSPINDGDLDSDCSDLADASLNADPSALNDDGSLTIGDFMSGWVMAEDLHDTSDGANTTWVSGTLEDSGDTVYLAVSREEGEGKVFYTAFRNAPSCPTRGFWPQERVTQYLIFQ